MLPDFEPYINPVILTYKRQHPEITSESDPILIPCRQMLMVRTLQYAYRAGKYDVDANNLEGEYQRACRSDIGGGQSLGREPYGAPGGSVFSARSLRGSPWTSFPVRR